MGLCLVDGSSFWGFGMGVGFDFRSFSLLKLKFEGFQLYFLEIKDFVL